MNLLSLAPIIIAPLVSSNSITTLLLIPLMILAFYFLLIRPQRKRQQQQQRMLSELGPGSRVVTHTGIFGTVVSMGDKQAELEIAPGIRVTVLRQTIARAVRPEDEDSAPPDDELPEGLAVAESGPASLQQPADTIPSGDEDDAPRPASQAEAEGDGGSGGIRDVTSSYFSSDPISSDPISSDPISSDSASGDTPDPEDRPTGTSAGHHDDDERALSSTLPTGDDYADRERVDDDRDRGDRQADKDS